MKKYIVLMLVFHLWPLSEVNAQENKGWRDVFIGRIEESKALEIQGKAFQNSFDENTIKVFQWNIK